MSDLSNPNAYSGIVKGLCGEGGSSVDFPTEITNPQNGQMLQYDATSEKWVNVDNEPCVLTFPFNFSDDVTATSEDIANYVLDVDGSPIVEGQSYDVYNYGFTLNDLINNNKLIKINQPVEGGDIFSLIYSYTIANNGNFYIVSFSSSINTPGSNNNPIISTIRITVSSMEISLKSFEPHR